MGIKAFTGIQQSKKLAEILPPESADMYYEPATGYCTKLSEVRFGNIKYAHPRSIRCWSLTALLRVIPKRIKFWNALSISITDEDFEIWYEKAGCEVNDELPHIIEKSPVDACVEMILKLNGLKLM